jgi:hypothetical protein
MVGQGKEALIDLGRYLYLGVLPEKTSYLTRMARSPFASKPVNARRSFRPCQVGIPLAADPTCVAASIPQGEGLRPAEGCGPATTATRR